MVRFGDTSTPMWPTEMGWLLDPKTHGPDYDLGSSFNWMKVPAQVQADDTVAALQYVQQNWLLSSRSSSSRP